MEWNAKLDWAEEVYTMLIVLPVPVMLAAVLWYIAPWLHRRRTARAAQDQTIVISGNAVGEKT